MVSFIRHHALAAVFAVQSFTESLPISSSTHVQLCIQWLVRHGVERQQFTGEHWEQIYYIAHLPTLLAFLLYLYADIWQLLLDMCARPYFVVELGAFFGLVSSITTAGYYLLRWLERRQLFSAAVIPLSINLMITGIALASTWFCSPYISGFCWSLQFAAVLGCVQAVALLPGFSRMALTTAAGCWYGLDMVHAVKVSLFAQAVMIVGAVLRAALQISPAEYRQIAYSRLLLWTVPLTLLSYGPLIIVGMLAAQNALWILCIYMLVLALGVHRFKCP